MIAGRNFDLFHNSLLKFNIDIIARKICDCNFNLVRFMEKGYNNTYSNKMRGVLSMRCPLCDGPVVNGRCKDCGMPYRKDEILYHLNESRSDHYKHASDKARKIMREQQRPQDTPKRMNGAAKSTAGRTTVSRQVIQEQQKKIRRDAMQKMSATRNTAGTTERYTRKPKKRSRFVWVWILFILVMSLAPAFGDFKDMVQDVVSSKSDSGNTYTDTEELDTYFSAEQDDNGYMFY